MADFHQLSGGEHGGSDDVSPGPPNGTKRKRQDSGGAQHRAKRNRYISIACNECKRRKIKCNGETPCQRCGNLDLECVYSPNCCSNNFRDSPEFKQLNAQVASLQEQINHLLYNLNALRSSNGQEDYQYPQDTVEFTQEQVRSSVAPQASVAIDPTLQTRPSQRSSPQQARFQGPTSSSFGLGVAHSSLRNMGIASAEEAISHGVLPHDDDEQRPVGKSMQSYSAKPVSPGATKPLHATKDPIWALSKDEALRLCRVFEDETYMMYPLLDMDALIRHAGMLFQFIDAISKSIMVSSMPGADDMQDQDTDMLKLVLAITMTIEGTGRSELGKRLFDNVNRSTDNRLLGSVNIKDIQILTLTALYHFHCDDEGLAWRVIGLTARLCLELGLHRSATYNTLFSTEHERMTALRLFWSIYVLDHRWSFGTGMSFALQESDIDHQLPKPAESPYLSAMIDYCNISAKCWKYITATDVSNIMFSKEDIHHLDFQIMQWYGNLPEHLRLIHPNSVEYAQYGGSDPNEADGHSIYRQRVLLHLRANQMRIAIYRTILYSSSSMQASLSSLTFAETAVEVAKDTIRILTHINTRSDIYKNRQTTYNHFLLSALAALFLAVCHAPAQFAEPSRDEFYMALDLVRGLSANSYVSKRLWRTIRGLKKLGPKVGLFARPGEKRGAKVRKISGINRDDMNNDYNTRETPQFSHDYQLQPQNDAQRSAAMAMAGLAGHPVDESVFFANNAQVLSSPNGIESTITRADSVTGQPLTSPHGMANELTSLFEAAGAYANGVTVSTPATDGSQSGFRNPNPEPSNGSPAGTDVSSGRMGLSGGVSDVGVDFRPWDTNDDELNRILKELF